MDPYFLTSTVSDQPDSSSSLGWIPGIMNTVEDSTQWQDTRIHDGQDTARQYEASYQNHLFPCAYCHLLFRTRHDCVRHMQYDHRAQGPQPATTHRDVDRWNEPQDVRYGCRNDVTYHVYGAGQQRATIDEMSLAQWQERGLAKQARSSMGNYCYDERNIPVHPSATFHEAELLTTVPLVQVQSTGARPEDYLRLPPLLSTAVSNTPLKNLDQFRLDTAALLSPCLTQTPSATDLHDRPSSARSHHMLLSPPASSNACRDDQSHSNLQCCDDHESEVLRETGDEEENRAGQELALIETAEPTYTTSAHASPADSLMSDTSSSETSEIIQAIHDLHDLIGKIQRLGCESSPASQRSAYTGDVGWNGEAVDAEEQNCVQDSQATSKTLSSQKDARRKRKVDDSTNDQPDGFESRQVRVQKLLGSFETQEKTQMTCPVNAMTTLEHNDDTRDALCHCWGTDPTPSQLLKSLLLKHRLLFCEKCKDIVRFQGDYFEELEYRRRVAAAPDTELQPMRRGEKPEAAKKRHDDGGCVRRCIGNECPAAKDKSLQQMAHEPGANCPTSWSCNAIANAHIWRYVCAKIYKSNKIIEPNFQPGPGYNHVSTDMPRVETGGSSRRIDATRLLRDDVTYLLREHTRLQGQVHQMRQDHEEEINRLRREHQQELSSLEERQSATEEVRIENLRLIIMELCESANIGRILRRRITAAVPEALSDVSTSALPSSIATQSKVGAGLPTPEPGTSLTPDKLPGPAPDASSFFPLSQETPVSALNEQFLDRRGSLPGSDMWHEMIAYDSLYEADANSNTQA